jgi:hypothetical protein
LYDQVVKVATALACVLLGSTALAAAATSPQQAVARAKQEWLAELRSSARTGDRDAVFPSPSRAVLVRRLGDAAKRHGFRIAGVRMLHPFQSAPVVVIRSDARERIARATPAIVAAIDPRHVTKTNPSGYAYEGYFLVAEDSRGVPFLATFNHWRAPHVGGGEWAASESLYPFPHG